MLPLPHRYVVTATPSAAAGVHLATHGAPTLPTAAPPEFDGPDDRWSPETLLVGAAADCFAITFVGVARASTLPWTAMTCEAAGTLDRDDVLRFTRLDLHVHVVLPEGGDDARARRVIDKVERSCLITNSLNAAVHVHATIDVPARAPDACPA